jgi:hypothetical protein
MRLGGATAAADRPGRGRAPTGSSRPRPPEAGGASAAGRGATSTWPARSTRPADWLHRRKLVRLPPSEWAHLDERKERVAEPGCTLGDPGLFGPH